VTLCLTGARNNNIAACLKKMEQFTEVMITDKTILRTNRNT
jgi:hypothetical protein